MFWTQTVLIREQNVFHPAFKLKYVSSYELGTVVVVIV